MHVHSNPQINSLVTVHTVPPVTMCAVTSPCFGPGSAQPIYLGLIRPISKKKNQKYLFQHFIIFPCNFYVILINIWWYFFMLLKIQKSDIKIPGFSSKNFQKYKKNKKFKNLQTIIVFFNTTLDIESFSTLIGLVLSIFIM